MYTNHTLGANGENWTIWGNDVFTGTVNLLSNAFTSYVNAKYGSAALQQVQQNPTSDSSQAILQQFLMWQMSQQNQQQQQPATQEKDNTMLYVLLGVGVLAFMMMGNDSRRR